MPRPTLKIVASQRDALYEQVRNHLAGLGDVVMALECQKGYPTAERLMIEFGEDCLSRLTPHASLTAVASKPACALGPDEENAEYEQAGKEEGVSAASAPPQSGLLALSRRRLRRRSQSQGRLSKCGALSS